MSDTFLDDERARSDAVQQFLLRRLQGDKVSPQQFANSFPELGTALLDQLKRAELVAAAKEQSQDDRIEPRSGSSRGQLSVRCPHCQALIQIESDTVWAELECATCHESFSLVDRSASTETALTEIGHFELLERLGIGAFGTVWRARDTKLNRIVALKIPRKGQLSEREASIFLREAQSAAQIVHPNVVHTYEVGREDDMLFIASELIDGPTLSDRMGEQRITPGESAALVAKIARGLNAAHQAGVVHRDLKPGNILLDPQGEPHITDFGLAKHQAREVTMTLDGALVGTPAYMSPEQASGNPQEADARSDVYALGVILFQMLTGELPFRGNATTILKQVVHDPPPSPRKLNHHVSRDLETICLKALEKAPGLRYDTAADMADELERTVRHEPILTRPIGIVGRLVRWAIRRPAAAAFALTTIASLTIGTIVSLTFAWAANEKARELATNVELLRSTAYAYDMTKSQRLIEAGNIEAAIRLLDRYNGNHELARLRRPEWHHWWRTIHGRQLALHQTDQALRGLAVDPDGTCFVWGNMQGELFAADKQLTRVRQLDTTHDGGIFEILFDDNARLYALSEDGTLTVSEFEQMGTDRLLATLTHPGQALAFGLSHDGRQVAVVGTAEPAESEITNSDSLIVIWDTAEWQSQAEIPMPRDVYWSLFWSPDDKKLLLGGEQDRYLVPLDDAEQVQRVRQGTEPTPFGRTSRWLEDEKVIAMRLLSNKTQITQESADGAERHTLIPQTNGGMAGLEVDSKQETLALPNVHKEIRIHDLKENSLVCTLYGHRNRLTGVEFFDSGTKLVSASDDGSVRVWDLRTGTNALRTRTTEPVLSDGNHWGRPVAFSPNGKTVAILESQHIVAYEIPDFDEVARIEVAPDGHAGALGRLAISPDSAFVLALLYSGRAHRMMEWSLETGLARAIPDDIVEWPRSISYSRDGKHFLVGTRSALARFPGQACGIHAFDREDFERTTSWRPDDSADMWAPHRMAISDICTTADGQQLYSVSTRDRKLKSWRVSDQQLLFTFVRENNYFGVNRVAVDPANERIATAWLDNLIVLVDNQGRELHTLSGHQDQITSLAFSDDALTLLSSSADGTAKLWDPEIGQVRATFAAEAPIVGASIRPQGAGVVAVDLTGKMYYWNCESMNISGAAQVDPLP